MAAFEAIKLPRNDWNTMPRAPVRTYAERHTTTDAYDVFRDLWRCEQILEAEHRECLRLMLEAE
jgi:hypothetical protein